MACICFVCANYPSVSAFLSMCLLLTSVRLEPMLPRMKWRGLACHEPKEVKEVLMLSFVSFLKPTAQNTCLTARKKYTRKNKIQAVQKDTNTRTTTSERAEGCHAAFMQCRRR